LTLRLDGPRPRSTTVLRLARFSLAAFAIFLAAGQARAQFQQPLVFSSGGAVMVRDDTTGVLTPTAGSPFPATNTTLTIDIKGRYLFGIGVNSIHMYAITDATAGAYQEVANSPFASLNTNEPIFIAVEPTGNYIAVVNAVGPSQYQASAETFQISPDASGGPALIPVPGSFTPLDSNVIGVSQPAASAAAFYLYLGPTFTTIPNFTKGEELNAVSVDPVTGLLQGISSANFDTSTARCYASDPQGRYVVTGSGEFEGVVDLMGIDGKFPGASLPLPSSTFPQSAWVDSTGTFLYLVTVSSSGLGPVQIYSLNLQTNALSETASSPLPNATFVPPYQPDPTGPFNYGFPPTANTISAFTVDPVTGYFIAAPDSPFSVLGAGELTFSVVAGQQGASGPSVQILPATLSLGTAQIGSPSMPQMIMLKSNGAEALSVNSIAVSGPDASEFAESDTCQTPAVLQPNNFCAVSITFTPTSAGAQSATVNITDNAPGSPQAVQLTGLGVAPPPPAPAVTITPNPAIFATIMQGTASAPMSIAVANSGNATLHISTLLIGGSNPGDFTNPSSNCSGAALAAGASCAISVTFAPLAAGQRSETIMLSDDAPNSPQTIAVQGDATAAPAPAVAIAPSPAIFAATTQGTASSPMKITVTNSGTLTLHISSAVIGGANSSDFTNPASNCSGAALAPNTSCAVSVTFTPLNAGQRMETVTLTDDAPNSPQIISVQGDATPAISVGPASNGSTTATVTAGATALYQLQITPGANYSGTIALGCSGAPLAAACQLPATIQVSSGAPAAFTVMVTTTGAAAQTPPLSPRTRLTPPHPDPRVVFPAEILLLFILLWWSLIGRRVFDQLPPLRARLRYGFAFAAVLTAVSLASVFSGCGGGATTAAVQPVQTVITPQGTSIITIMPSANGVSGQPLQLSPVQLTLTVN
jgi:hypothetical protein